MTTYVERDDYQGWRGWLLMLDHRWTFYGPLPRCHAQYSDPHFGFHCFRLIWPWQRSDGPMHIACRKRGDGWPE